MEKSIKINVPEGYEIDKEKSTFEEIVFKKKDTKPQSWDEYCANGNKLRKYYINLGSDVSRCNDDGRLRKTSDRNLINSREEAEAFLALMQLRLLRKAWVGEWEPNYNNGCLKWHIHFVSDLPCVQRNYETQRTISFPTREMAEEFLKYFRNLIEKAKVLL